MKRLIGNLYWTNRGLGYRVDSPGKAKLYNRILLGCVVLGIAGIVAVLVLV